MSESTFNEQDPLVLDRMRGFRQDLQNALSDATAREREDVIRELELHVLESARQATGSAEKRLDQAIASLGPMSSFLPDLAEELRTQSAAAHGSMVAASTLLVQNLGHDLLRSLLLMGCGLSMLFALLLSVIVLATLWLPDAGLYWNGIADFTLSFEAQRGAPKVSNWLFVPAALVLAAGIYFGCARLLVRTLRRGKDRPAY